MVTTKRKNEITPHQICAILLTILPMTKVITAPSFLAHYCNEKLWQPALILYIADILLITIILWAQRMCGNKTFFQILSDSYGKIFAKIIFIIYTIFFIFKSILPIIEHKELIDNALYDTLPRTTIFFTAFIVLFYICVKGLQSYARSCELCAVIALIGIALVFFLSITTGDFATLLPLLKGTTLNTPICAYKSLFWFNDAIYLLLFMGNFKIKKRTTAKICISYAASAVAILFFLVTFYSVFNYIADTQKLAISEVSIFSVSLVNVGRFDYLAVFLLTLSGVFAIALPILAATTFLKDVLETKNPYISAAIICSILFIVLILFSSKYYNILNFFTKYLSPFFWLLGYILPVALLFFAALFSRKNQTDNQIINNASAPTDNQISVKTDSNTDNQISVETDSNTDNKTSNDRDSQTDNISKNTENKQLSTDKTEVITNNLPRRSEK